MAAPGQPNHMAWMDGADPTPGPGDLVVGVHHVSLNRGDLNDAISGRVGAGTVLGSDLSGVVLAAAEDGSGPPVRTRVFALAAGAFARRVAVDARSVARAPDELELGLAAALSVAGVAALRAVRQSGGLRDKRVLITGASGGVGTFAVQLAAADGAHVIASVGRASRGRGLRALGAQEVIVGADADGPVDVVIDTVGGPTLVHAWKRLSAGGVLHSVGWASGEPAVFPPYATVGARKTLISQLNEGPVDRDLATLAELCVRGVLNVRVGWRGPWDRVDEASTALLERRVDGKAILDLVDPASTAPLPSGTRQN